MTPFRGGVSEKCRISMFNWYYTKWK